VSVYGVNTVASRHVSLRTEKFINFDYINNDMGADLYIPEIREPLIKKYKALYEKAQRKKDHDKAWKYFDKMYEQGYFRDNYNSSSVLWRLSWWNDVVPLCDELGELNGANLKRFRDMVAASKLRRLTKRQLQRQRATFLEDLGGVKEWNEHYRMRRKELLGFLDQAIKLKTSVFCSL
jgi:pentatricopeptide repeat protein